MSLTSQLSEVFEGFQKKAPQNVQNVIQASVSDLQKSFPSRTPIRTGSLLPDFALANATGRTVTKQQLLAKGPILISFYRGEWCPFCSLELVALQKRMDDFQSRGVQIVAISPQLANGSLTTVEKHSLKFEVLSDVGNHFARELGIVWKQPESLRPLFANFGHDLNARNGDDSFGVPIPATLLVDRSGVVRNIFLDPDYKKRLEPDVALQWVDAL